MRLDNNIAARPAGAGGAVGGGGGETTERDQLMAD